MLAKTSKVENAGGMAFLPSSRFVLQRKCACAESDAKTNECEECKSEHLSLQRKSINHRKVPDASPLVQEVLQSPGHPLDDGTRSFMESQFGHNFGKVAVQKTVSQISPAGVSIGSPNDRYEAEADQFAQGNWENPDHGNGKEAAMETAFDFSKVRIHADAKAAFSARAVNALAYTVGQHIIFGQNQFAPESPSGRKLLAHELTHFLQQEGTPRDHSECLQRQPADGESVPPRELPPHKAKAPSMRPAEGGIVQGFPVTRATCRCLPDIKVWEDKNQKAIEAYRACAPPRTKTIPEYGNCVVLKVYGEALGPKAALKVPSAATADPFTSKIEMPTEEESKTRGEMLGEKFKEPESGPCVPLLTWSTLVHETRHIEQFSEIAAKMGPEFAAEFEKLEGDPERMQKLRRRFPKAVQKYIAESLFSLKARVPMEIEATERAQKFLADVRAVLDSICKPPEPDVEPPKTERF